MKWVIFTGTWRLTNEEVERDVRLSVLEVLMNGDGVITGGALGVDLFCMDEVLKVNPSCTHLRVILPTKLDLYIKHFYESLLDDKITRKSFEKLEQTLRGIQKINPTSILEMHFTEVNQNEYNERDSEEVKYGDEVFAFQVNNSMGTQDTINKAIDKGIPITLHKKYLINEN